MDVPFQQREFPPANLVRPRVQRVSLSHVIPHRLLGFRLLSRDFLGVARFVVAIRVRVACFFVIPVIRIGSPPRFLDNFGLTLLVTGIIPKPLVVVIRVNEPLHVVILVPFPGLTHRVPVRGFLFQKLGNEHQGAARERRARVLRDLQQTLHHRRGALRPRVVLQRAECEGQQLPGRGA